MSRVTGHPAAPALARLVRAVTDRVKRWRGHPPEKAGVREPRRPKPTLPSAAVGRAADLMIAATAASNALPLYTANPDDFKEAEGFLEVVGIQARPNAL